MRVFCCRREHLRFPRRTALSATLFSGTPRALDSATLGLPRLPQPLRPPPPPPPRAGGDRVLRRLPALPAPAPPLAARGGADRAKHVDRRRVCLRRTGGLE